MADFNSFNQNNDTYIGNPNRKEMPKLPPGAYKLDFNQNTGELYFKKFEVNYDSLIDLPSPEYEEVMKEVNIFLDDEAKALFKEYNYLYKRSFLLWGLHGTGKTCIVNRVGEKVIAKDGIIIFNPHPKLLEMAFKILDDIQPNITTMVIFEEFEQILARFEDEMLSLLDGEVQKPNVMYLATTNHFDKIPARLKRPGRFPTILEVKYPNAQARKAYLEQKLKARDMGEIPNWVKETEGLSIDELKETVLAVKCLKKPLDEIVNRIKSTKKISSDAEQGEGDWEESDYDDGSIEYALREMTKRAANNGMLLKKGR
jgi:hypothetical protein